MQIMKFQDCFTDESLDFLSRMLQQSGVGPSTAWPPGTVQCLEGKRADTSAEAARKESEVKSITVHIKCVKIFIMKLISRS